MPPNLDSSCKLFILNVEFSLNTLCVVTVILNIVMFEFDITRMYVIK